MRYVDRADAGRRIGPLVGAVLDGRRVEGITPLVLGVPRGGVVTAAPVARSLGGQLDLALARKIGAPNNPELAIGAVAESGEPVLDESLINRLGVSTDFIAAATNRARTELQRRASSYRGDRTPPSATGRIVVVVDDGIATGATLYVTLQAIRKQSPDLLLCAVPVGAPDSIARVATVVDEMVCPLRPRWFRAVGEWYETFDQTSDAEVITLLESMRKGRDA
jgi:predicted phosphoribosyltransferase